jgi:hypothetical protein
MASSSTPVSLVQTRGTEWSSVPSDNLPIVVMPGAYVILMSNLRRMKLVLTSTETRHPRRIFMKCLKVRLEETEEYEYGVKRYCRVSAVKSGC